MKIVITSFMFLAGLFSGPVAFADQALVKEIYDLTHEVRKSSERTDISKETLEETRAKLREILNYMDEDGHGGSVGPEGCLKFAYDRYSSGLSNASATDKAVEACRIITDMNVARFLFEKHYSSVSATTAMDLTVKGSIKTRGKLDMIVFAYEKYYASMGASTAATKASQGVSKIPRGSLQCLKDLYNNYYSSSTSSEAISKAIAGCSK